MGNNLIDVVNHFKRLRNLKYGFHTLVPGFLINLYDTSKDDGRAFHHILQYDEDIDLFKHPILLTSDFSKFINEYIKEAEKIRKEGKIKPKDVNYLYAIKENEKTLDIVFYVEGIKYPNKMVRIDLIKKDTIYYKEQMQIISRINVVTPKERNIVEYAVSDRLYDILKEMEDVDFLDLKLGNVTLKMPMAISSFFSLRKMPDNMRIEACTTKNDNLYMVTLLYDTEFFKERHICYLLQR